MELIKGKTPNSWCICIYGVPGVGKSTLANYAPDAVFIDVEGGIDRIDAIKTPKIDDWPELHAALRWAYGSEKKTIVIDSLSAVEEILVKKILQDVNTGREEKYFVESLSDKVAFPYGSGYALLKAKWSLFCKMLFDIKGKGKNVVCVGHECVEKVENPSGENYDRYTINVHKNSRDLIVSKMDAVLFAHYDKVLKNKNRAEMDGTKKVVALATGDRVLQTVEMPYCIAKNRFDLPEQLSFKEESDRQNVFKVIV